MKDKSKDILQICSCLVLTLIAYIPTIQWMIDRWMAKESYYGHAFLIPVVSLYIMWQRRNLFKKTEVKRGWNGLFLISAGLLIHLICASLRVYFVSGFSLVFVLYGLVLFFFGKKMARNLIFPIFFLLAMIPLPLVLIGNLTVKLKLFVAEVSTVILNNIGFPSVRDGSAIIMPNSYILVEAPCSGLRSLISLVTLGLLFAFNIKASYFKKGVLFLSSMPIAVATNLMRITMLAMVNDLYGEKIAMGFFHDFSGFVMFGVAFVGLLGMSRVLEGRGGRAPREEGRKMRGT